MGNFNQNNNDSYLKGGTKEACSIAREFLRNASVSNNQISSETSNFNTQEFINSVYTLIAFASKEKDTIPEKWKCEADCALLSFSGCPGEYGISKTADKMCPFFTDEGFI